MDKKIKLPMAIQLRIDDVAWHNGADERHIGRPSRSGMPRIHHWKDYLFLNELGKALGQKITASIVIGEWDKDNLIKGRVGLSWDPYGWDRASQIDLDYANKAMEILEGSDYVDYTIHGVLHGHYAEDGTQITEKELYTLAYDEKSDKYDKNRIIWHSYENIKLHVDTFFEIYESWGFKKRIKSIACGNGNYGLPYDAGNQMYAKLFSQYGIDVWQDAWKNLKGTSEVVEGVTCLKFNASRCTIPWDSVGFNPADAIAWHEEGDDNYYSDYVTHWPNYLDMNPDNNGKYLSGWVDYYKRQGRVFGYMLSEDVSFAASQAVYNRYAKMEITENKCIIDCSEVDAKNARSLRNDFYISIKNDITPKGCVGGTVSKYAPGDGFVTYKIEREGKGKTEILF